MKVQLDPIWRASTQQKIFKQLVQVISRPGEIAELDEVLGGERAAMGVLSTLVDRMVSVADPDGAIPPGAWPLLEARSAVVSDADYVVVNGKKPPGRDFEPRLGELSHPERGSTIIVEIDRLGADEGARLELRGPGVRDTCSVCCAGLDVAWIECRRCWVSHFPLGIDLFVTDATRVLAIPRTTQVGTD